MDSRRTLEQNDTTTTPNYQHYRHGFRNNGRGLHKPCCSSECVEQDAFECGPPAARAAAPDAVLLESGQAATPRNLNTYGSDSVFPHIGW